MSIEFTQFLMPDGRRKRITIECPPQIEEKAEAIKNAGLDFECEVLRNGMVSFTCTDDEADQFIELCNNGSGVPKTVEKLINNAYSNLEKYKKAKSN